MTAKRVRKRQVCDQCSGRFGMVTHRWWGKKFCKRACRDLNIHAVALDRNLIPRLLWFARLRRRARAAGPAVLCVQ